MKPLLVLFLAIPLAGQSPYPWLEGLAQRQLAERRQVVAGLRTPEEIRAYGRGVREKLLRWMGGLPAERTTLNVRRTGVIEREDYRVEKIVFASQPGFWVTANLYVPKTGAGPFPAVVQPTGHSLTAKARELYQSLSIGLVKYGFVVLTYDPLGQGERRIFFDRELGDSKVGGTTVEHQMVGIQSLLGGESLARAMVWDGMRALDVLAGRPEVDAQRMGVAGCSGGGTLTAYLAALDARVQAAAPACYISAWEEQLGGTGPQDAEQQFPDQLREGFNHGDLLIAAAPRPYLIASTTEDFFPLAGARRTYEEAKAIYNRFGAEDKIAWFTAPGGHGMRADTRGAIYGWMRKWLQGKAGAAPEPRLAVELEEDLQVSATGQIGGETASTVNLRRLGAIRPAPGSGPGGLAEQVRAVTRYEPYAGPLGVEELGGGRLRYEAEPGRWVPARVWRPAAANGTAVVVAGDAAAAGALAAAGYTVLAVDVALTGETVHRAGSYANEWFPQDKAIWLALMVGRTVTGMRMADLVRGVDVLRERGLVGEKGVMGWARGNAGVAMLHAAVVDGRLRELVLEDLPPTYRTMATTPIQRQIFDVVLPNVLRSYDLPDLVAAVGPRRVVLGRTAAAREEGYGGAHVRTVRRRELAGAVETYLVQPEGGQ
ncbi:MAG: alpha/beta hydrolase family protein [Acidobacteriota bacterium]